MEFNLPDNIQKERRRRRKAIPQVALAAQNFTEEGRYIHDTTNIIRNPENWKDTLATRTYVDEALSDFEVPSSGPEFKTVQANRNSQDGINFLNIITPRANDVYTGYSTTGNSDTATGFIYIDWTNLAINESFSIITGSHNFTTLATRTSATSPNHSFYVETNPTGSNGQYLMHRGEYTVIRTGTSTATIVAHKYDSRPYRVYTALLTQTGTDAPVATVLENTLGKTINWTRFSAGIYRGTFSSAYTGDLDKIMFDSRETLEYNSLNNSFSIRQSISETRVSLSTYVVDLSTGVKSNSDINILYKPIEIRVYN